MGQIDRLHERLETLGLFVLQSAMGRLWWRMINTDDEGVSREWVWSGLLVKRELLCGLRSGLGALVGRKHC